MIRNAWSFHSNRYLRSGVGDMELRSASKEIIKLPYVSAAGVDTQAKSSDWLVGKILVECRGERGTAVSLSMKLGTSQSELN